MSGKAWRDWKDISELDKVELLRSELNVTSGFTNVLFFGMIVLVSMVSSYTIFTVWIPALFLLMAAISFVGRWRKNSGVVGRLRGSVLQRVFTEQAERKAEAEKARLKK